MVRVNNYSLLFVFMHFAGPRATEAARIHHYTIGSEICQVKIFFKIFSTFFLKPIDKQPPICYNNNCQGAIKNLPPQGYEMYHRLKVVKSQKFFKNPLTNNFIYAILKMLRGQRGRQTGLWLIRSLCQSHKKE